MSIGSSSSRSVTSYESKTYDGGSLTSNGLITVEAKSADAIKGNIKAIGETITGKEVKLIASNDVSFEAAANTSKKLEDYKSKGWSVGANISVNGGGILGLDASVNAAKQKGNTETKTHTATTVTGTDSVHIESGKDTNIIGSKVKGNTVTADIGGNLHIESLQDINKYIGENSSKGISISTNGASLGNVSAENKTGTMKSNYASVTDQAGIYAGEGGFNINTKGNTSLKGAVIHSDADADKNKLTTGTLTTESIENTAEYTSRSTGIGYNHVGNFKSLSKEGKDAVWNTLGTLPTLQPDSKKSAHSTTNSAISNGTIEVREQAINLDEISRDTEHSLNKLDEIFDKKKVEERQELSQRFAKEAFGQLHYWNPTSLEGKAAKSIAHGVVAEISARMAGNKAGSGFYAGATNEALIGEINKIAKNRPDVAQWLSASLGSVVNAGIGNSPVTGAAVAQYGTKWNYQGTMKIDGKIVPEAKYQAIKQKDGTYKFYVADVDMKYSKEIEENQVPYGAIIWYYYGDDYKGDGSDWGETFVKRNGQLYAVKGSFELRYDSNDGGIIYHKLDNEARASLSNAGINLVNSKSKAVEDINALEANRFKLTSEVKALRNDIIEKNGIRFFEGNIKEHKSNYYKNVAKKITKKDLDDAEESLRNYWTPKMEAYGPSTVDALNTFMTKNRDTLIGQYGITDVNKINLKGPNNRVQTYDIVTYGQNSQVARAMLHYENKVLEIAANTVKNVGGRSGVTNTMRTWSDSYDSALPLISEQYYLAGKFTAISTVRYDANTRDYLVTITFSDGYDNHISRAHGPNSLNVQKPVAQLEAGSRYKPFYWKTEPINLVIPGYKLDAYMSSTEDSKNDRFLNKSQ